MTSFEAPVSEEEARILESVARSGQQVFVVVNKRDAVDAAQRAEVLKHLAGRLQAIFGRGGPAVFPLSAIEALTARRRGDQARLAASGVPALERALVQFLLNEKRRVLLCNICRRVGELIAPEDAASRARLELIETELAKAPAPQVAAPLTSEIPATIKECEVCVRVAEATFRFLAAQQYQLGGDEKARAALETRGGFCGPHTWQFEAMAAPKEIATAFPGVLERQAGRLRHVAWLGADRTGTSRMVAAALPTAATCAACTVARRAAREAVAALAGRLKRDLAGALRSLSAICLPHLAELVTASEEPEAMQAVRQREADLMERLAEDLRGFALKRDGMARHLTSGEEAAAGERGLRMLLGDPRAATGPARAALTGPGADTRFAFGGDGVPPRTPSG